MRPGSGPPLKSNNERAGRRSVSLVPHPLQPVRDEKGQLVRWYATGTDIDDRKRAEDRTVNENVSVARRYRTLIHVREIVVPPTIAKVMDQVSKVAPTDSQCWF